MATKLPKEAEPDFEVSVHWLVQFGPYSSREQVIRLANEGVSVRSDARGRFYAGLSLQNLWRRELEKVTAEQLDADDPLKQAQIDNLRSRTRMNDLELAKLESELMPVAQHVEQMADLAKYFATFLDTLPDVLERSAGLTPEQVSELVRKVTSVRADLYKNALSIVLPDKQSVVGPARGSGKPRNPASAKTGQSKRKRDSEPAD
ncbi:DUF1441 family protein [Paraburkholderia youngii]|uniref:DUF1441 family protein n=1 Tax=Paraburkholderia youngii TaxID=2782701 RepID=UPI001591A1F3|nr:DUF1441 family protein [Paraburkholderia youngii]NUX55934.1 DUF1441 family protein [Paraburkholderia youngii]